MSRFPLTDKVPFWIAHADTEYGHCNPSKDCYRYRPSEEAVGADNYLHPNKHGEAPRQRDEKLRDNEIIMRDLIALDKRARFLSKGSREDLCLADFIQHMF